MSGPNALWHIDVNHKLIRSAVIMFEDDEWEEDGDEEEDGDKEFVVVLTSVSTSSKYLAKELLIKCTLSVLVYSCIRIQNISVW